MINETGQIQIPVKGLPVNIYPVRISFGGNENYETCSKFVTIVIRKDIPKILASDVVAVVNEVDYLFAGLTDSQGQPIAGANITFFLNDESEIFTSNETGEIKVPLIGLDIGSYRARLLFRGDENYEATSKYANIHILDKNDTAIILSDLTVLYNEESYLNVSLERGNGHPVAGVNLTVDLNGIKNYTTDNEGIIRIPTKGLPVGMYDVSVIFEGNDDYEGSNVCSNYCP